MTTAAARPAPAPLLTAPPAGAQQLAVLLSAAVRIEPQLVRAVRLALLPELDVGAEGDLWFSDWVSGRSSELIILDPAIRPHLYQRLAGWLRKYGPAAGERLRDQIRRAHAEISPALQVEEEALWLALSGGSDDAIDAALAPALQALAAQGRAGVAEWFLSAWQRLPGTAQRTRGAWQIAQVAIQQRPAASPAPVPAPADLRVDDLAPVAGALPEVRLGVRRAGPELWLGDLSDATAQIMVPDTDPRVVEIGGRTAQTVFVARGATAHVTVGEAAVVLRTGLGTAYRLAGREEAPSRPAEASPGPGIAARLRLSLHRDDEGYLIDLLLEDASAVRQEATTRVGFELSAQDREELRWYLEDYPEYPAEPAPSIAARVETRLAELGTELFQQVFTRNRDTRPLWDRVVRVLGDTRVEIVADAEHSAAIPWELLRNPARDQVVALEASSFVHSSPAAPAILPSAAAAAEALRVLLVICRPAGPEDIPYRAVARQVVRLSQQAPDELRLDVLRPPTFDRLTEVLEEAHASGAPYHMVHFDGHGAYLDEQTLAVTSSAMYRSELLVQAPQSGPRGFLLFEHPSRDNNQQLVDGPTIGRLLARTGISVLLLNACRSAHADPRPVPDTVSESADLRQLASYESLAAEVVDAGVAGVIAMRYNVYVTTAARFTGDVYAAILGGRTLGEAVALARRGLAADPWREIAGPAVSLQDWLVPVVHEAVPLTLHAGGRSLPISLSDEPGWAERAALRLGLPPEPDTGFIGRDSTLLAVERAFYSVHLVLLHGWAGAGKTATAVEFAGWYAATGGADAVLFSSFEHHLPLTRLLDQIGDLFGSILSRSGVRWARLSGGQRRDVAIQILAQISLVWVWDGVQPVAGFPVGTSSEWTEDERSELAGFLRDLAGTRCKVLLTSRHEEREWLGDLPARVDLPPMRMQDRLELARAVAVRQSGVSSDAVNVEAWRRLLQFTQGNPLTVVVLASLAIRERLTTLEQIRGFVDGLRAGAGSGVDEPVDLGRDRSLSASLDYGFSQAFTDAERAVLALLALFQGFVDVETLRAMGDPDVVDEPVRTVSGMDRETWLALLDRAADVGLLSTRGDGFYAVHPAVPQYLQNLFAQHYGPPDSSASVQARQTWTAAIGQLASRRAGQYEQGRGEVAVILAADENNLLLARRMAIGNDWYSLVLGPMRGLNALYGLTGRTIEWGRLVGEVVPLVTDPSIDGPLPGREHQWAEVTEYRIGLALRARDWPAAASLLGYTIAWRREQAAAALALAPETLGDQPRRQVRDLATSLGQWAIMLLAQGDPGCMPAYQEALELFQRIGARREEAHIALGLGDAYLTVASLRDIDQAERWYRRALEMLEEQDTLGTARALARLGGVAYERFIDLAAAGESSDRLAGILNDVVQLGIRALDLTPEEASADLARIYRQLGAAFREADDIERSLINYQRALQHEERQADPYGAGQTRYGAALTLSRAGRLADALLYARAALRDYERTGPGANTDAERARELIARLERGETEPERPPQRPNVGYYVVQADWRGRHQER